MLSRMRRTRSTGLTLDALAATKLALNAIQASTDAFPPLKFVVSAVIVILELSEKPKSNKKGCEHIAHRSAQLVQDIWRQTKDFNISWREALLRSKHMLFNEVENFLDFVTILASNRS
ncbi:hypothetical protein B0H19DRAFT_194668 [Mycena capillaripes]|nr:hypothetical protein B0H19DRAFT_194668 [Mycena capillaripes]